MSLFVRQKVQISSKIATSPEMLPVFRHPKKRWSFQLCIYCYCC